MPVMHNEHSLEVHNLLMKNIFDMKLVIPFLILSYHTLAELVHKWRFCGGQICSM